MREEARRWIVQADADLAHARASIRAGFHFAAAFACHQAAEKWLKGASIELQRSMPPKTYNLVELGRLRAVSEEVLSDLRLLNPEYATSRYPDAANGVPAENCDERKATMLLEAAAGLLLIALRRRSRKDPIPFGPALAVGGIVALLAAEPVVAWYLRL